jgi:hypothetical protein
MKQLLTFVFCIGITVVQITAQDYQGEARWWKGNTHTHTWWSDGDAPPEIAADWYKSSGYNFLVLSEHNVMANGIKWYRLRTPAHQTSLEKYKEKFGEDWVVERTSPGKHEVKLKTMAEYHSLFDEAGTFLLIPGEEITNSFEERQIHINGVNLIELIMPRKGSNVAETIKATMTDVKEQSEKLEQPMFAHLNHPNFYFSNRVEDFWDVESPAFFEIFNGHPTVHNYGDEMHISTERMWDIALTKRLQDFKMGPIWGVGSDDTHNYNEFSQDHSNYGRGWVMVRAKRLTPNSITQAMREGDFYASTGVTLSDVKMDGKTISVEVDEVPGVEYTIQFIGTKKGVDTTGTLRTDDPEIYTSMKYSDEIGVVLKEEKGTSASYTSNGDELYVRVKVTSTKEKENPIETEKYQMAWTQPMVVE